MKHKRQKHAKSSIVPNTDKRPRVGAEPPHITKRPRAVAPPIVYDDHPSWRFNKLDTGGPWCWRKMTPDELERLIPRLQAWESRTWREILEGAGKLNHPITIDRLCKTAQARIVEIKVDDVDDVISLRVTGRERVWGVRYGAVLRLLWWDPRHEVYPTEKKHT